MPVVQHYDDNSTGGNDSYICMSKESMNPPSKNGIPKILVSSKLSLVVYLLYK